MSILKNRNNNNEEGILLFEIYSNIFSLYNPKDEEYTNQVSQVYENIVAKFYPSIQPITTRTELLRF